jgi:hypothetical protein
MDTMLQAVTIHRPADRHADIHKRQFARTCEAVVPAGSAATVVEAALSVLNMHEVEGRLTLSISDPFEGES